MYYINLITNCHVAIGSIVHCWEVVKRDIAVQDRKSGGEVLLTGLGLKYSDCGMANMYILFEKVRKIFIR